MLGGEIEMQIARIVSGDQTGVDRGAIEAEFGMKPVVLNVAGPRESKSPGIQTATKVFIERVLSNGEKTNGNATAR